MNDERDAEFLACERAGMSARQIAERFRITERTVARWRARLGVSHRPPTITRPPSVHRRAEELLDEGCSFSEVARSVGVDRITICRWFPDRSPWTKHQSGEYAALVRKWRDIA